MASTKKNRFWTWLWNDENKNSDESKQKTSNQIASKNNQTNTTTSSNIAKAREAFFEIESLIQRELSLLNTDDDEDDAQLIRTNKSATSKSNPDSGKISSSKGKRPGPKLIKPLNKKKNKMVLGPMVYDPTNNVWLGNEEDLSVFGRGGPSLITNSENNKKDSMKVGDMIFDPVEGVWRGNEQDLKKFGPSLISQPKPLSEPIVHGSMTFDPETMTWRGNDDAVDIFDDIEIVDTQKGFKVGDEFTLTPDLIQLFHRCEEQHNRLLSGWFSTDYDKTGRSHLSAIRSMSIIKIINQAKTGTIPAKKDDPKSPSNASTSKFSVTKLNKKPTNNKSEPDEWDDVAVPSNGKIALKQSLSRTSSVSSVDWESNEESGSADLSDAGLAKYQDSDDFDDLDFDDTKLKKFASPSKQFTDAEKDYVLELQQPKQDNLQDSWEDSDSHDDFPTTPTTTSNLDQNISTFVDDDDWNDIDVDSLPVQPTSIVPPKQKAVANKPKKTEDSDFSDGLEFSTNTKLALRPRALSTADRNEEDWSDIEIPGGLVLQPKNPNIVKK